MKNIYIDAEKLKAEIENRIALLKGFNSKGDYAKGSIDADTGILEYITSLQQEQPVEGLEDEIDAVWNPRFNLGWDEHSCLTMNRAGFASIAHHFAEWGAIHLNARKEK